MPMVNKARKRSPWILHFDTGSCNGCDMEIWTILTPRYDIERFGSLNMANPKHADIFLITGPVTARCEDRLRNLYDQAPEPKLVVACGDCASSGAPFHFCYNVAKGVDKIIPVDVYVPGCAARPEALIDGLLLALSLWERKVDEMERRER